MFQFPSKVLFLAPITFVLISYGLIRVRKKVLALVLLLVILSGQAYGLNNYFQGKQFLNPKYLVPWVKIEQDISARAGQQDLILSDEEAFFHTLKATRCPIESFGLVGALEKVDQTLKTKGPMTVYLVIRYRGDETIVVEALKVRDQLESIYPKLNVWQYVPADPEAVPYWKRFLGKEPYPFLVEVYRFQVPANESVGVP
jgi:hypothetical protein